MFLPRSLCEDVISRLGSHVPGGGIPPTNTTTLKHWFGCMSTPSFPPTPYSHLYYLFPFSLYWPNHSRTIFQPGAFFAVNNFISVDMGYSLEHYLYYVIAFHYRLALNHMAHDSGSCASITDHNSHSCKEYGSKEELFSYCSHKSTTVIQQISSRKHFQWIIN